MSNVTTTTKKFATLVTKNSVTVNYDGETHVVLAGTPAYDQAIAAIKEGRQEDLPTIMSKAKHIEKASSGTFLVRDGKVLVDGNIPVSPLLGDRIIEHSEEGLPFEPLVNFARKLNGNPSYRSIQQLFAFLERNHHPITEDGNFIAYKKVRRRDDGALVDIHSGTFVNDPGSMCEMPRNQVDEDPTVTCSHGLHVANWDYAQNHFGNSDDPMVEVEVNPADVVAVPTDYDQSKMRVCRYKVRDVVVNPNENRHVTRSSNSPLPADNNNDSDDDDFDSNSEEEPILKECGHRQLDTGSYDDATEDCDACDATEYRDCHTCNGTVEFTNGGYVDCPDCDGTGTVSEYTSETTSVVDELDNNDSDEVVFQTEKQMRRMPSVRLERYEEELRDMSRDVRNLAGWKATHKFAKQLLKNRGIL